MHIPRRKDQSTRHNTTLTKIQLKSILPNILRVVACSQSAKRNSLEMNSKN